MVQWRWRNELLHGAEPARLMIARRHEGATHASHGEGREAGPWTAGERARRAALEAAVGEH
jgi:hypothetical protein